jgi:hypothetical protein
VAVLGGAVAKGSDTDRGTGVLGLGDVVLADREPAQRLIAKIGDETDPQFRIASPDNDWWTATTLSGTPRKACGSLS